VVKTRGRKNRAPAIILIILIFGAAYLLSRSVLKREGTEVFKGQETQETPTMKPEKEPTRVPPEPEPVPEPERAKIAVIIDDVGYSSPTLNGYLGFEGKLTFSVLPFQPESVRAAQLLYQRGFEIMLHIPMEPLDYPAQQPGEDALFLSDTRDMVEDKLNRMIVEIPHVEGANNHMGSRATQDPQLMSWTLSYLQRKGFYFVDSLTTPHSRAYEIAKAMDLPSAKRDVFLDNQRDLPYIKGQFEEAKVIARRRGSAVAVGHLQSENLLRVLNEELSRLEEEGFELVFVSEVASN
jgi:polysaccharide deacetylase 2 family uncharacterized protein YibQ